MTTEEWVRKLNKLSAEIDEGCAATHPSAWTEQPISGMIEKYKELAKVVPYDPPTQMKLEL